MALCTSSVSSTTTMSSRSYSSAILSTACSLVMPFSIISDSSALTRAAISSSDAGKRPETGGAEPTFGVVVMLFSPSLGRLEVRLPEVEADAVALTVLVGAPHLGRVEADVVDGLGVLALLPRVGVGKDERAVNSLDYALLAAQIARAARVARGVDVPHAHAVTGLELRLRVAVAARRRTAA